MGVNSADFGQITPYILFLGFVNIFYAFFIFTFVSLRQLGLKERQSLLR